ncbi:hypothetical protein HMN09_01275200 [Mycena chlorophos]|uniref:Uncharacterized protein n=1 Tax=Mycena chlorophos TaxID=658473 RepID=A0A8H6S443_MYCCL|nr:hypothetical protein HMN09_01275200 [Mycena chlorophos]
MPGTGPLRSSSSTAGPPPPLTVPLRNGTRGRIIEILAHTANGCLNELGYSPGMIEREQALLGENAQLKQHNAVLAERLDQYVDENRKLYEDNSRLILQAGSANKERIVAKNESGRLREELKQFREFEGQDKVEVVQQYARLVRDHQAVLGQYHSLVDDLQRRGILSANPANPNPNGPQVAPTLPPSHQQHQQAQPQHWQGPQQNARPVQQQQQQALFASQQQQHPPVHIPAQPNANSHGPANNITFKVSRLRRRDRLLDRASISSFLRGCNQSPSPLSTQIPPPPSMLQQQQYASMPNSSSSMPQSQQSHLHQQHHRSPTMPMPPNMHSQHPQHPQQQQQQQQRRRSDGQMIHAAQQYQQQQAGLQSMLLTQNGRPVQAQAPGQSPTGQQHAHSPSQSSPLSGFLSVFPPHEQQQQQPQRMDQPQPQVRTQNQLQAPHGQPSVLLSQGAPVYSRSPPPLPIASSSSSSNQIPPHHPVTMIPERTNSLPSSLPISRHPQQQQRPQPQHLPTPPNSGPTPPLPLPPAQSLHTISPNSLAGAFGMHAMVPQRVSNQMPPQPQQASELVLNIANFPSHNDAVSGGMPLQGPQPQGPPPMASLQRPMPEPMPHVSALPVMTTSVEVITVTPSSQQVDGSVRGSDGMASTSPIVVPNDPENVPGTDSNCVEERPASRPHVTVHAPVSDAGPSRPPSATVDHVPDSSSLLPPPQQLEPEPDADADVPMPGPEDTPSPAQDSGTSSSSEGHEAITPPPQPPMQPSLKRPSTERDDVDEDDDPRKRPRVEDGVAADTDGVQVKREMLDEAEGMGTDTEQVMPQAASAATQNETLKAEPMTEEEKDRRMAEAEAAADNEFVEVGPDGKRTKEDCVEQMFDADLVCMFCRRRALAVHEPVPPSWADKTIEQRIEHCETEHEPVWEILRNMVGEEDDEDGAGGESGEDD